jgi:TetR/AcrR family transcriptional repressor of nem operon
MPRTGRPRSFDDDAVLDAARDLFWRRLYATTSLRDLKEELGVLPGSLYAAFGDKHALFLRALSRYAEGARAATASLEGEGPIVPRIRAFVSQSLLAARVAPGRGCMLGNTAVELLPDDEEARRVVRDAFDALESALARALAAAQRAREIREDVDCGAQARLLLVLVQGLHVVARAERDPRRLEDAIDAALSPLVVTKRRRARRPPGRGSKRPARGAAARDANG